MIDLPRGTIARLSLEQEQIHGKSGGDVSIGVHGSLLSVLDAAAQGGVR